jgi:alkanesulfonate monooxygenase SsuD/methylene tetrahydromethanopterin reductase-like flavin-dependent oxidoreductase (luciferase family)
MTQKIQIGLIDFGIRTKTMTPKDVMYDVIEQAKYAEKLGFNRLWLSEHHSCAPHAGWLDPLVLLTIIAGVTENIRVGIAGTMLSIHNAYSIALHYKLLANLFPNRIDLGLATANTPDNIKSNIPKNDFSVEEKIELIIKLFYQKNQSCSDGNSMIPPYGGELPNLILLNSSYSRLNQVNANGLSLSRSIFHKGNVNYNKEMIEEFKSVYFRTHGKLPDLTLAFSGCCHRSEKKARVIADNIDYGGIDSPNVVGCPETFYEKVCILQEQYGFDDFIFLNMAATPDDRRLGLRLVSKRFGLQK